MIAQGKTTELEAAFCDDYRFQHSEDRMIAVREALR